MAIMGTFFSVPMVVVFTICIDISMLQHTIPVVSLKSNISSKCPSLEERRETRQLLQLVVREIIQTSYGIHISAECGLGRWRRAFYVNASQPDQSCPGDWSVQTSPERGCAGVSSQCSSAFSGDINTAYSKVCGRIIGEGVSSPDGFIRGPQDRTIEGNYLDGVSVTHGDSESRTHIWSFRAGHSVSYANSGIERCPCANNDRNEAPLPPAEVGDNYFCDRADELDRLWTGENCMNDNPCCSFHNPPYFSVQLPTVTTDRIELQICSNQHQSDENMHTGAVW